MDCLLVIQKSPQQAAAGGMLELSQGLDLYLPDTLASDIKLLPDLL